MSRPAVCLFVALLAAVPGDSRGQTPAPGPPSVEFVPGELIVRLTDGDSAAKLAALLAKVGAVDVKSLETADGLYIVKLPDTMSVTSADALASALQGVAYAEPNYLVHTQVTPNDPSFSDPNLWGLRNTGQSGGTAGADIQAPEAWDLTTGSSSVVVALIDTGIDYTHPDLAANMFRNEADCNSNGVDDDENGYIDDCHGIDTANNDGDPLDDNNHGTHTAGTVGAAGNNGVGVVGVNWNVKLMPCKFLNAGGSGSTADAVTCLNYVALMKDRGANIVATSNSWGGGGFSQAMYDAIDAQRQRGILFIAAAGNDASDNDSTANYPSNYDLPNVIAVAATTRTDARSSFSSYGRHTVHVGAPGSSILSTTRNNTYSTFSGTSMATPHVAGVAALLKAQDPGRDWRAIRNLILAGGDANANLSNTITGKRLNAYGSLSCSNSKVFSRLRPVQSAITGYVGVPLTLTALNINCAAGNGDVVVAVSPDNSTVTLKDDGVTPDQAAGDGIYSGSFVPSASKQFVLTFPGNDKLTVQVLSPVPYSVQSTAFSYRSIAGTSLNLGDDTSATIAPPFAIAFAGARFSSLFVSSNGTVNFEKASFKEYNNESLPTSQIGALIAPFWDDLVSDGASQNVYWATIGAAPHRELVVEWRNVSLFECLDNTKTVTFQVVFFEDREDILFSYADVTTCSSRDRGSAATIGIQVSPGSATEYSFNTAKISDGTALLWTLPPSVNALTGFTDDPLTSGGTVTRAVHIAELRTRINTVRGKFGLAAATWTDPSIVAGVTSPKAQHLIEMRTAISEAYQAAALIPPVFTDPTVQAAQSPIRAAHIAELRAAVLQLEKTQDGRRQP